jgi:hypothetical protein
LKIIVDDPDLLYQLQIRADELCHLCATWRTKVAPIPCPYTMSSSWGPSEKQLLDAAANEVQSSWNIQQDDTESGFLGSDESSGSDVGGDDVLDEELLESVEAISFTDAYRDSSSDLAVLDFDFLTLPGNDSTDTNRSPHKHSRI